MLRSGRRRTEGLRSTSVGAVQTSPGRLAPPDLVRPCPKTQSVLKLYEFDDSKCTKKESHRTMSCETLFMDLRGVEPLSENPSITASPITVCYFAFAVPSVHRKQTRFEP